MACISEACTTTSTTTRICAMRESDHCNEPYLTKQRHTDQSAVVPDHRLSSRNMNGASCDVNLLLCLCFVSLAQFVQSIRPLWRTRRNRSSVASKMAQPESVSLCPCPSSSSSTSSTSIASTRRMSVSTNSHRSPPLHLLSPLVLTSLLFLVFSAMPSSVSSNANSPSFPTFSYCSYIFNTEPRLVRRNRSPGVEQTESDESESTTLLPEEHSPVVLESHRHHGHSHHQARPFSQPSHRRHESYPHTQSHRSTVSMHAESGDKSRRSAEPLQSVSSASSAKLSTDNRGPMSSTESPSSPATADGLDPSKSPEQERISNFDSHYYYQQTFQHQFQFSYSPPSNSHPVYIGLEIIDVDLINDAKNFFSLQLHMFELWHEPRLNTSALQMFWATNSDPIPVNEANIADCLWTPQVVFEDSSESEQLLPPTSILLAYKNRVLLRKSRHSLKVRCHMNLQIYPMDKHLCHFKLRTFTDPVHKVDLRWLNDPDSPKRNLLDMKQNRCVVHRDEFTPSLFDIKLGAADRFNHVWLNEHYSLLDVEFIFERRIIHSLLTVYIPSSLVVTLSWLQFWFDVEAVPGRMSLGIMSTLTIMTQILTNYEKAGNHVTAVDIWLFVCLIMVFLALMEYAVAYTISHYYDGDLGGPPVWNQNYPLQLGYPHKPASMQSSASDSGYKPEAEPFFNSNVPASVRSNLLRNRRNGANLPLNQSPQHTASNDANNKSSTLFKLKNLPLSPIASANSGSDPESGTATELGIKDISLDNAPGPSPLPPASPLPPNQMEDEESKLLGGHHLEEDLHLHSRPAISKEELEEARLEVHQAMTRLDDLMLKQYEDNLRTAPQALANNVLAKPDNRMRKRATMDPNNNNGCPNCACGGGGSDGHKKDKPVGKSRFSLRRPPLRRQFSSRNVERSPSGLSEVDYCSRYVFPIAFVLFVVIYWIALIYYKLTS